MINQFCGSFWALMSRSSLTVSEYWPLSVATEAMTNAHTDRTGSGE